jgi:hypothetical protein
MESHRISPVKFAYVHRDASDPNGSRKIGMCSTDASVSWPAWMASEFWGNEKSLSSLREFITLGRPRAGQPAEGSQELAAARNVSRCSTAGFALNAKQGRTALGFSLVIHQERPVYGRFFTHHRYPAVRFIGRCIGSYIPPA